MKTVSRVVAALLILCIALGFASKKADAADVVYFTGDTYAAIAYSESTGRYGYYYNAGSRYQAEQGAKRECNAPDAEVVVWVNNGFCALAIGENGTYGWGYSYGSGSTNTDAKKRAVEECLKRSGKVKRVICVCSVDRKPEIYE